MKYDDIINLPHHVSKTRKHMSNYDRAAQFAPFAALNGYDEELDETARLTDEKKAIEADDEKKDRLDRTIQYLNEHAKEHPLIEVNYFIPDTKKEGGEYATASGSFKRIDESEFCLVFTDGRKVYITDIYDIIIS